MPRNRDLNFHGSSSVDEIAGSSHWEPAPPPGSRARQRGSGDGAAATPYRVETLTYDVSHHQHPYVAELADRLVNRTVQGLQDADTARRGGPGSEYELHEEFFEDDYGPVTHPAVPEDVEVVSTRPPLVSEPYPANTLDFSYRGGYSVYNWELFFHVPLTIAVHLSRNGRYQEAQRWFHFLFDPTDSSDASAPAHQRYWKVRPFQTTDTPSTADILHHLAAGGDDELRQAAEDAIERWRRDPFRPHLVARYRPTAYMYKTVMAYLDNLIAWGDSLFREDTGEAVSEAAQLYVLAANILGPRPQQTPRRGNAGPRTYHELIGKLDEFGNALVALETDLPLDQGPLPTAPGAGAGAAQVATVRGVGQTLLFCVPPNDRLLGYWDTVADRLFKIRNSLSLRGIFRQLPLFEPPIDPALLARATAAGLDVSAVVSGLHQPLPLVRFRLLVRHAIELCQEVKGLGAQLLSAMEKRDAEQLAILRARHETALLEQAEAVRYAQVQEAAKARESLEKGIANATQRLAYYERLLGADPPTVPDLDELDLEGLRDQRYAQAEPDLEPREPRVKTARDPDQLGAGTALNAHEIESLQGQQQAARMQGKAASTHGILQMLALLPTFTVSTQPLGFGGQLHFGTSNFTALFGAKASVEAATAGQWSHEAGLAGTVGGHVRREQEYALQSALSAGEINLTLRQLRAAQIREAIAQRELRNHRAQTERSREIETFLADERNRKDTNRDLYAYLAREVRGLYTQYLQLAGEVARKAERALGHELGDPPTSHLATGYLAGKEGLLAGEKLYLDLKRMELAYHEQNRREYELTTHVSLRQLDPVALLRLRATGRCTVTVPEQWFDLECPGHFFRRIKTVAVSIPCVTGPYASVNCTVTQLKSAIRTSPRLADGDYAPQSDGDERFSTHFGTAQSIVTSSGQNDPGLFEANPTDERYLPFEGTGAVSEWQLELPSELPRFDHDSITDVILHLRYTAREGGQPLREAATANLRSAVEAAAAAGCVQLLSVRQEFPTEWARFTAAEGTPAPLALVLREEHYPAWSRAVSPLRLTRAELFASQGGAPIEVFSDPDSPTPAASLVTDPSLGDLRVGTLAEPPAATGELTLYLTANTLTDLWLGLTWGAG